MLLLIGMIFTTVAFIDNPISYAEKKNVKTGKGGQIQF